MEYATQTIDKLIQSGITRSGFYHVNQEHLNELINRKIYKLNSAWVFDANSAVIIAPHKKFYLTQKEILFLKMLLKNEGIITYTDMIAILWNGGKYVTLNALRLFAKNFKKKLPPEILKNYQSIGYKLDL